MQIVEGFQARFILTNLAYLTTLLLAVALILFAKSGWQLLAHPGNGDTAETADRFLLLHAIVWPTLLGILLVSACQLTITTHKVAGPLVRFRRIFQQMGDGNFRGPVTLRTGDYLQAEAALLTVALATIERRDAQCRAALDQAEAAVAAAGAARQPAGLTDALTTATRHLATARALFPDPGRPDDAPKPALRLVPGAGPPADSTRRQGFTVIELLIVVALIGVIAAMAYPRYTEALYAARVARAIGDINGIGKEISVYQLLNGRLPASLADVDRDLTRDPWGNLYEYLPLDGSLDVASSWGNDPAPPTAATSGAAGQGKGGGNGGRSGGGGNGGGNGGGSGGGGSAGRARKDRNLHPLNADFDLYSKGRDGESVAALTAKASHDDIVRASNGGFVGLASKF